MPDKPEKTPPSLAESLGDFLTVAEVAEALRVNQMTVRNWVSDGQLPAVRAGQRRVRIRRRDLEAFLTQAGGDLAPRTKPDAIDDRIGDLQDQIRGLRARVELLERAAGDSDPA